MPLPLSRTHYRKEMMEKFVSFGSRAYWLTLGLVLFADDDYTEVASKVTGSLDRFGCWSAGWRCTARAGTPRTGTSKA